jgi:putative Holliday junction resolvase
MTGRLAALDVGDKRIGVAISDALRLTAQPVGTVQRRSLAADCEAVQRLLAPYQDGPGIEKVIAGLPLTPRGEEGEQADRVRHFCRRFEAETGRTVVFQDERFTSAEGDRMLIETGVRRSKRREVRDRVAAALILQAWLDSQPRP